MTMIVNMINVFNGGGDDGNDDNDDDVDINQAPFYKHNRGQLQLSNCFLLTFRVNSCSQYHISSTKAFIFMISFHFQFDVTCCNLCRTGCSVRATMTSAKSTIRPVASNYIFLCLICIFWDTFSDYNNLKQ